MLNRTYATQLQYCADEHAKTHKPGMTTDIFNGLYYRSLLEERVVAGDRMFPHNYFLDHRDIALSFATDGFAPFKRQKLTAWILLVFNYNLPPEQRFQKDNILCVGIIPGLKKPWDADSFIYPLVCELLELTAGMSTYDALLTVVHWYMQYLLRWISRQRHDQVSELCLISLHRVWLPWCTVNCVLFGATVHHCHTH